MLFIFRLILVKLDFLNNGSLCKLIPFALILITVVIKLIAPSNEDTPARCKLKIAKSTEPPE